MTHNLITEIADRCATREVDALTDFYNLGALVVSGELGYEKARDQLVAAFVKRNLTGSTAKTYLSQGYCLAQLFDTFDELAEWADDECKGSRSLKRLYDTARKGAKGEGEGEGEGAAAELAVAAPTTDADRRDAIVAILRSMSDSACIASVRDTAADMLGHNPVLAAA